MEPGEGRPGRSWGARGGASRPVRNTAAPAAAFVSLAAVPRAEDFKISKSLGGAESSVSSKPARGHRELQDSQGYIAAVCSS